MKRISIFFLAAFIAIAGGCTPESKVDPDEGNGTEQPGKPGGGENPGGSENPGGGSEGSEGETVEVTVIDPGATKEEGVKPTPQHPDLLHEVGYVEFFNPLQDELDEFGNIDYVCAQGKGTDWPFITDNGAIRFYQSTSATRSGGYIRVRAHNGAKLLNVTVGSATSTMLAHSVDGKAKKSENKAVAAGETYSVKGEYDEICFYCMGADKSERWEMNSINVSYRGGFVEEDFKGAEQKEYGPLVRVALPFKEGFEAGFPRMDTPSYYKYGTTAGRENLQWSTWYGSFSWQGPIDGEQSAQLRIYQEDPDYYGNTQFGHLKMEYFIENLSRVSFKYRFSEYWPTVTISYCEFNSTEWKNPQQIALKKYSDRGKVWDFTYELGSKVNAKIRIEIDPESGYATSGHHNLIFDDFVFE